MILILGVHSIEVRYGDRHIVGSPFRCRVYDLSKIKILRDESEPGVDLDGIPGEDIVFYGACYTSFIALLLN